MRKKGYEYWFRNMTRNYKPMNNLNMIICGGIHFEGKITISFINDIIYIYIYYMDIYYAGIINYEC